MNDIRCLQVSVPPLTASVGEDGSGSVKEMSFPPFSCLRALVDSPKDVSIEMLRLSSYVVKHELTSKHPLGETALLFAEWEVVTMGYAL